MPTGFWDFNFWIQTSKSTKLLISFFTTKSKPDQPKISLRMFHYYPFTEHISPNNDGYFPVKGKGLYINPELLRELARGLLLARKAILIHNQSNN